MITAEELDRAVAAGKVSLTHRNKKSVRCQCCGRWQPPGVALKVFVDGHDRGYLGPECTRGLGDD